MKKLVNKKDCGNRSVSQERGVIKTHNGMFHSDEVFAIALIKAYIAMIDNNGDILYNYDVVRTRDDSFKADITIDVDGVYDEDRLMFDHHQDSYNGSLSSVGMVAKYITEKLGVQLKSRLLDFITELDTNDTGVKRSDSYIINIVRKMNYPDVHSTEQNSAFKRAVQYAERVIYRMQSEKDTTVTNDMIGYAIATEPVMNCFHCGYESSPVEVQLGINDRKRKELAKYIDKAIGNAEVDKETLKEIDGIVLRFKKDDEYVPVRYLIGKADVAIQFDYNDDCWVIQTVPVSIRNYYSRVLLKPTADAFFTHKNGFISKSSTPNFSYVINTQPYTA